MKKRISVILTSIIALVLAAVMISGCSFISNSSRTNYGANTDKDSVVAAQSVKFNTTAKSRDIEDAFLDAVKEVERTSVQITTESGEAGSGVIVDVAWQASEHNDAAWKNDDNIVYIITCHHVVSKDGTYGVEGVGKIEVSIPDENCHYDNADYIFYGYIGNKTPSVYKSQGYAISLVGGDFESDVALLKLDLSVAAKSGNKLSMDKIEKAQIPYMSAENPYNVQVGETVFSVGNPAGILPGSVSRGIVSYLDRTIPVSDIGSMTLIQTDVSSNFGNSGGGLYNIYGELVGIINAKFYKMNDTYFTNLNFAIPCYLENGNGFADIVAQLFGTATENNYGYVSGRKVKFGFTYSEYTEDGTSHVYVLSVSSGSISANKGLQVNDEIVSVVVNRGEETLVSQNVNTMNEFKAIMDDLTAGDSVSLNIKRTTYNYWGRGSTQSKTITMLTEGFLFCNTGM